VFFSSITLLTCLSSNRAPFNPDLKSYYKLNPKLQPFQTETVTIAQGSETFQVLTSFVAHMCRLHT